MQQTEGKKTRKRWVPEPGGALHRKPVRDEAANAKRKLLDMADDIFDRFVSGESLDAIAQTLPVKVPGWKLRTILMDSEETRELYASAVVHRAHALVERAIEHGVNAAALGDAAGLRTAIDVNLKVASKLMPAAYGDTKKVELTGANGGPMKIVALTDEQLMEIAARGAKEADE